MNPDQTPQQKPTGTIPLHSAPPVAGQPNPEEWLQKDPVPPSTPTSKKFKALLTNKKVLLVIGAILVVTLLNVVLFALVKPNRDSHLQTPSPPPPVPQNQSGTQMPISPESASENNDTSNTTNTASSRDSTSGDSTSATGGSSGSSSNPSPPPPSPSPVDTYEISYTNSCFNPADRNIKKGDTIKFVNNSNKDMWPASNNHPSHSIYPEFDASSSIAPGGTYSFTFTKLGPWGYHDHNKPSCSGIITVQ